MIASQRSRAPERSTFWGRVPHFAASGRVTADQQPLDSQALSPDQALNAMPPQGRPPTQGVPAPAPDVLTPDQALNYNPPNTATQNNTPQSSGPWHNFEAGVMQGTEFLQDWMTPSGLIANAGHALFGTPKASSATDTIARRENIAPDQVAAQTPVDYVARGAGAGLVSAPVGVEGGLLGSVGSMAAGAGVGAASGAGQYAGEHLAPAGWEGVGGAAGALLGGAAAGTGMGALGLLRPETPEQAAVSKVQSLATDPDRLNSVLGQSSNPAQEIVPGSKPTLAQLVPDTGLAQAETVYRNQNDALFRDVRNQQNSARLTALQGIESNVAGPQEVGQVFRDQLAAIDQLHQAKVDQITSQSAAALAAHDQLVGNARDTLNNSIRDISGNDLSGPDNATSTQIRGQAARSALQAADDEKAGAENRLWGIVRQHGALQFPADGIGRAATQLMAEVQPQPGELPTTTTLGALDGPVVNTLAHWQGPVSLDTLRAQRSDITSRLNQAYRGGDRQAARRLEILKGQIDTALDQGLTDTAQQEQHAVASGDIAPHPFLGGDLEGESRQWLAASRARQRQASGLAGSGASRIGNGPSGSPAIPGSYGTTSQAAAGSNGPRSAIGNPGVAPDQGIPVSPADAQAAYTAARQATRDRRSAFGEGPIGQILKPGPFGAQYAMPDSAVLPTLFRSNGNGAAEAVQGLVKAVGPDQAQSLVQHQAAADLLASARNPDGTLNLMRYRGWLNKHSDALSPFPALQQRFAQPQGAQEALDQLTAQRDALARQGQEAGRSAQSVHADALGQFGKSAAQVWLGTDPDKAAAAILGRKNSADLASELVRRVQHDPDALSGLRRSFLDEVMRRAQTTAPAAEGETMLGAATYRKTVANNRAALSRIFSPQQMGTLDQVAADLERAERTGSGAAARVGPGTARDIIQQSRMTQERPSLFRAVVGSLGRFGAMAAGDMSGGIGGAFISREGMRVVGDFVNYLRQQHIAEREDLVAHMLANPDLARTMFHEVTTSNVGTLTGRAMKALLRSSNIAAAGQSEQPQRRAMGGLVGNPMQGIGRLTRSLTGGAQGSSAGQMPMPLGMGLPRVL